MDEYYEDVDAKELENIRNNYSRWGMAGPTVPWLLEQIDTLRKWVADLHSGMYINCVYCGHNYGPKDSHQSSKAAELYDHIRTCPKHPMSRLIKENEKLRKIVEDEKLRREILSEVLADEGWHFWAKKALKKLED